MKFMGLALVNLFIFANAYAAPHVCAHDARQKAIQLFALHYGLDEATAELSITENFVKRPPVTSPNGKMNYDVLETIAEIGRGGAYRIRLIYAVFNEPNGSTDCLLMGQEILDLSSL